MIPRPPKYGCLFLATATSTLLRIARRPPPQHRCRPGPSVTFLVIGLGRILREDVDTVLVPATRSRATSLHVRDLDGHPWFQLSDGTDPIWPA